jgi:hypothetical protein
MRIRAWLACAMATLPLWALACGSGGSSGPPPSPCASSQVPSTVQLHVSGFDKCACFNGTFALTQATTGIIDEPQVWSSQPITGCPGQTDPAYLKLSVESGSFGIGICDQGSDPGSGNSDFSPVTGGSCSPFSLSGGGSRAGNINSFCPGVEDLYMSWSAGK